MVIFHSYVSLPEARAFPLGFGGSVSEVWWFYHNFWDVYAQFAGEILIFGVFQDLHCFKALSFWLIVHRNPQKKRRLYSPL